MSEIRSFRKKIIRHLTGQNPNTESTYVLFEQARSIQKNLPSNPLKHTSFAAQVQASLNFDRGMISLTEAIEEGQI